MDKGFTMKRAMGLWSTAFGYEVRTIRQGGNKIRIRIYNVHHFSMRRFYSLSNNDINIRRDKPVDFRTFMAVA